MRIHWRVVRRGRARDRRRFRRLGTNLPGAWSRRTAGRQRSRASRFRRRCRLGADLQGYINRARPGDVLLLEPGATYVGNFTLPASAAEQPSSVPAQFITIRSAADDSHFPTGGRVGPSTLQWMPIVRSPNGESALATKPGAHHWRLQWLAFQANAEGAGNIISLGDGGERQRDLASGPAPPPARWSHHSRRCGERPEARDRAEQR